MADAESFGFYLSALDSIEVISEGVRAAAEAGDDPEGFHASYESARLSTIQVILRYAVDIEDEGQQEECLNLLLQRVGVLSVLRAAATYFPGALGYLRRHRSLLGVRGERTVRTVLLFTGNLGSGGVQGVVVSQAKHLLEAGFRVIVGLRSMEETVHELPEAVEVVAISGRTVGDRLASFDEICREHEVDVVLDHYILYNNDWPFFVLAAGIQGIPTIGWLHNFALRPVFDFTRRTSFLVDNLPLLERAVTLSPTDVVFWRARGVENVTYLPNPPSPWLLQRPEDSQVRSLGSRPLRLVWWGRIQQHTKRVRDLIEVAVALRHLEVDFVLRIIGPDSKDLTAQELRDYALEKGVEDYIVLPGLLHGDELLGELQDSDLYLCTSAIEGYPLTLIEAQALGLPVVMYELPWLAVLEGNQGLVSAPQGDARQLARTVAEISEAPDFYRELSEGALQAAERALSHNFAELYTDLLHGTLPEPVVGEDARESYEVLLGQAVSFHEENVGRQAYRINQQKERYAALKQDWRRLKKLALEQRAQLRELNRESRRLKGVALEARADARAEKREARRMKAEVVKLQAEIQEKQEQISRLNGAGDGDAKGQGRGRWRRRRTP